MVRRYEETIEVREGVRDDLTPASWGCRCRGGWRCPGRGAREPDAFVWRGRLYVVRAVLDRWQERRPWWRDARERDGAATCSPMPASGRSGGSRRAPAASAGVGVYDLGADHGDQWRLLRVAD